MFAAAMLLINLLRTNYRQITFSYLVNTILGIGNGSAVFNDRMGIIQTDTAAISHLIIDTHLPRLEDEGSRYVFKFRYPLPYEISVWILVHRLLDW